MREDNGCQSIWSEAVPRYVVKSWPMIKKTILSMAFTCLLGLPSLAADWPAMHGNADHTGVTSEQLTLPLSLAWVTQADQAPSPAFPRRMATVRNPTSIPLSYDYAYRTVIADNRLYFGTSTEEAVYCLAATTGARQWRSYVDGAVRMPPTLDGGKVYVGTDGGSVYCLDGASGAALWRFRAGPTNFACVGSSRIASSWPVRTEVVLTNGVAYFAAGVYPTTGVYLCAVNAATGAQIWQRPIQIGPNGAIRIVDGDKLWISCGRVSPFEFRLSDGEPVIPDPDRRAGVGGWWIGSVDGLPAWGPAEGETVLLRISSNSPPRSWGGDHSYTYPNAVPHGIISGLGGYCAFAADKFYLLGRDNAVMAVPLEDFRAACARRATQIQALTRWSYGWAGYQKTVNDDPPLTADLAAHAAWTAAIPDDDGFKARWGIVAGNTMFVGGPDRVVALDGDTGTLVWSGAVEGEAHGLAVADGALFVSTDKGAIYCFRHGTGEPVTHAPSFSSPYANGSVYAEAARLAVAAAGRTRGYCFVLGVGQGELAYQIARQSEFSVVGLDKDPDAVTAARAKLAQAGVYGNRVVVYHEPNDTPDYANYLANLIVSDSAITTGTVPYSPQGALRLLQPYSGTIVLGSVGGEMDLNGWTDTQLSLWTPTNGAAAVTWQVARRGELPGAGEWTQEYANPANTVSSNERLVSTNLQVQWFGPPGGADMVDRHAMAMPPLVKNGKLFRMGAFSPSQRNGVTSVTAIDVYNGTTLWTTSVLLSGRRNAGHNTHPCACIGDSIFVTSTTNCCYEIDATTGKELHTFTGTLPGYDWGYVGGLGNCLIGTSQGTDVDREVQKVRNWAANAFTSKPAVSRDLFVYDLTTRQKLWTYTGGAILNVSITVNADGNTLYFVESRNAAGMANTTGQLEFGDFLAGEGENGARIVALDLQTGTTRWTQPVTRNVDKPDQWLLYLTYADGVLLISRTYHCEREDGKTWYGYDFEALDANAGGKTLWQVWKPAPYVNKGYTWKNPLHSHPFYANGRFYFLARYYGTVYSYDPHTGAETADPSIGRGWEQSEGKSCTTPAASASAFYFRWNSHHMYDLSTQTVFDVTRVSRPGCWMSTIPACGVLTMLDQSAGCSCGFPLQQSVVFAPGSGPASRPLSPRRPAAGRTR